MSSRTTFWVGLAVGLGVVGFAGVILTFALLARAYITLAKDMTREKRVEIAREFGTSMQSPEATKLRTLAQLEKPTPAQPTPPKTFAQEIAAYLAEPVRQNAVQAAHQRLGRDADPEIIAFTVAARSDEDLTDEDRRAHDQAIERMTDDPKAFLPLAQAALENARLASGAQAEYEQLKLLVETLTAAASRPADDRTIVVPEDETRAPASD